MTVIKEELCEGVSFCVSLVGFCFWGEGRGCSVLYLSFGYKTLMIWEIFLTDHPLSGVDCVNFRSCNVLV